MNYKDTVNFQTNPNPRDAIPHHTTGTTTTMFDCFANS